MFSEEGHCFCLADRNKVFQSGMRSGNRSACIFLVILFPVSGHFTPHKNSATETTLCSRRFLELFFYAVFSFRHSCKLRLHTLPKLTLSFSSAWDTSRFHSFCESNSCLVQNVLLCRYQALPQIHRLQFCVMYFVILKKLQQFCPVFYDKRTIWIHLLHHEYQQRKI